MEAVWLGIPEEIEMSTVNVERWVHDDVRDKGQSESREREREREHICKTQNLSHYSLLYDIIIITRKCNY